MQVRCPRPASISGASASGSLPLMEPCENILRSRKTNRTHPTFPGYTAIFWNARKEEGRVRTDNYIERLSVSGSCVSPTSRLSVLLFSTTRLRCFLRLPVDYPVCIGIACFHENVYEMLISLIKATVFCCKS